MGSPRIFIWVDMTLRDLIGEKTAVAEFEAGNIARLTLGRHYKET